MKTPRLFNYLQRYWILIVLWLACSAAVWTNVTFLMLGTVLYVPFLGLSVALVALLIRNVYNTDTTDPYSDSGQLRRDWEGLPPLAKVIITKAEFLIYFLGLCLIAASLSRP